MTPVAPPSFCVAGVALGDMDLCFASAGVALDDMDLRFAWQAWHLATWTCVSRGRGGRRGTWRHGLAFRVAGVALGDMDLRFGWEARHLWDWAGRA